MHFPHFEHNMNFPSSFKMLFNASYEVKFQKNSMNRFGEKILKNLG